MKHLKSYNESVHPDLNRLKEKDDSGLYLNYIDYYDSLLKFDSIWTNYIDNLFIKSGLEDYDMKVDTFGHLRNTGEYNSMEELVSNHKNPIEIIEFAQKRYEELKKDNEDDLDIIKSIFEDLEDDCADFISSIEFTDYSNHVKFQYRVSIGIVKSLISDRNTYSTAFFRSNEIKNFWPHLIKATSSIESLNMEVLLEYKASDPYIKFTINRKR